MAVIAFLNQNISIAAIWGSFSVLLTAVEMRLGVGRALSTLAVPAVNLAAAIGAPIIGGLAARYSLRLIMSAGALLGLAGFTLLAVSHSYFLYLVAFGLLLGPGMAIGGILPSTLITRWYSVNRGRTLGIICAPVVIVVVPFASNWMLQSHGVAAVYLMLASLSLVCVVSNIFIVDRPPGYATIAETRTSVAGAPTGPMGMLQLLRAPRFWVFTLGYASASAGLIILTAHQVPMARSWGFSAELAASLISIQCLAGIGGTVIFGWIADRLGSARVLVILLLDTAVLWLLLILHPAFPVTAAIIGLIGMHGLGVMPVVASALSENFGRESFSRAYGLLNLINLPFTVLAVPAAAIIYARTGSYNRVCLGEAVFVGLVGVISSVVLMGAVARRRVQNSPALRES